MPTIGCDPEVVVLVDRGNGKRFVPAETFFNDQAKRVGKYGSIGRDGARMLAELRPSPSTKPEEVVGSMGFLLKDLLESTDKNGELAVGSFSPGAGGIGGHFHAWGREKTQAKICRIAPAEAICLGLSYLWLLEDYDAGKERRKDGHYGHVLDVRNSNFSREFRSPSSDWLSHPTLAKHCLSYFKSLVNSSDKIFKDDSHRQETMSKADQFWGLPSSRRALPDVPTTITNRELYMAIRDEYREHHRVLERAGNAAYQQALDAGRRAWEEDGRPIGVSIELYIDRELRRRRDILGRDQAKKPVVMSLADRGGYLDSIVKEVKTYVNKEDLHAVEFFAERIGNLRSSDKLIRLDLNKWRVK